MTPLESAALVGIGGAIGALLRYAIVARVTVEQFPLGTLVVNALGTFVLGVVVFAGLDGRAVRFLGTGLCGAFTTFSSFSVDTVRLWDAGYRRRAAANALGNLAAAAIALVIAWGLVQLALG